MTKINQSIPNGGDGRYIAGDTARLELTIEKENGTAKKIQGADIAFALAKYSGDSPIIEKDNSNSDITIVDGENGRVDIRLDGDETDELGASNGKQYYYEITVRDSTGDINTVTAGNWTIYSDTATI